MRGKIHVPSPLPARSPRPKPELNGGFGCSVHAVSWARGASRRAGRMFCHARLWHETLPGLLQQIHCPLQGRTMLEIGKEHQSNTQGAIGVQTELKKLEWVKIWCFYAVSWVSVQTNCAHLLESFRLEKTLRSQSPADIWCLYM